MKRNIDALLRARGLHRQDLAAWCRKSPSWLTKIMNEDQREFPMKYFDRIADFFGVATYQLLQPGLGSGTERRKPADRRAGRDRRVGRSGLERVTPRSTQSALVELIGHLSEEEQQRFVRAIGDTLRGRLTPPTPDTHAAGPGSVGQKRGPSAAGVRGMRRE